MKNTMDLIEGYFFNELSESEIQEVKQKYETDIQFKKSFLDYQQTFLIIEEIEHGHELKALQKTQAQNQHFFIKPKQFVLLASVLLLFLMISYWLWSSYSQTKQIPIAKDQLKPKSDQKIVTQDSLKPKEQKKQSSEQPKEKLLPFEKSKEETMLAFNDAPDAFWENEVKVFEGIAPKNDNRGNENAKVQILAPQNRSKFKQKVNFAWKLKEQEGNSSFILRIINNRQKQVLSKELQSDTFEWEQKDIPKGRYYWLLALQNQNNEETIFVGEFFVE